MLRHLLVLEWKKFRQNTVFKILIFMFVVLMPLVLLSVKDLFKDIPPPLPSSKVFYQFPDVWEYQGYVGSWLVSLLLGFLAIYLMSSEFSQKTLRQNVITGMKKSELFWGKVLFLVTISFLATMVYAFSTIVLGMVHSEVSGISSIWDNEWAIFRFFLMCIGYLSIAFFFVILLRKGILAIIVFMLYMLILEPILMALYVYQFKNVGRNYFPMNSIEDLMPFPLYRLPDYFITQEWNFSILLSYNQAMIMTTFYSLLFITMSYFLFLKRDI